MHNALQVEEMLRIAHPRSTVHGICWMSRGVLILEVTAARKQEKEAKTATARTLQVPAVNNHGGFGRWAFLEVTDPYDSVGELIRAMAT